ncbi:YbaB/EbfC family nucleoid-associated protein [Nocardia sp. NPDC046473]|uniref:YbaB/EbfC family nucleoid-associated protein n=1 Tax=Nocardia sp. NPDC046473 TaxID=3155733 RepID=UPI0033C9B33F
MTRSSDRLKSDVAQVLDDVGQLIAGMAGARQRLQALTASAETERGRVLVVVDASGAVTEVSFADDVDDLDYKQLARAVVAAAQQAAAQVKRRSDAIMAPLHAAQARLPQLSDLVVWMPRQDGIPQPPPALLTPPGDRVATDLFDIERDGPTPVPHGAGDTADSAAVSGISAVADQAAEIIRLQDLRAKLVATGTAEGRRVSAAVNADCILIDLKFSTGIGDLDYDEIAEAIAEAARQAVSAVARMATALFAPIAADRTGFPGPAAILTGVEQLRDQLR